MVYNLTVLNMLYLFCVNSTDVCLRNFTVPKENDSHSAITLHLVFFPQLLISVSLSFLSLID